MNRVHSIDYRVVIDFLSSIPCSRSLCVAILWRYGEFDQIVSLGFNPFDYNDLEHARWSLQATELLRKHEDLPTSFVREDIAKEGFFLAEERCGQTNLRLRTDRSRFAPLIHRMVRKISDVLGEFDPHEFVDSAGWGPGATLSIRRRDATPSNKFRREAECTQPLLRFVKPWFGLIYPRWALNPRIANRNKVITVPKNAKTDRIIAIEPSLNLFFQKGIGAMIRRRLRRFGVDLNDQQLNQSLALVGSRDGSLATIDFSAASDTIAYQLVLDLLPFRWFEVLDALRSGRGSIGDSQIEYEKFSSMGNGFTFELESLIFWAAAVASVPEDHPDVSCISSYGDDVIIPSDCVGTFSALCDFLGFEVNKRKSYSSSYYRESCGKHYWDGVDITPIYLRRYLKDLETMRFHNRVVELSRRSIAPGFRDSRFKGVIAFLRDASPIKVGIPVGYGDLGLISDFDQVCPSFHRGYSRGWRSKALIPVPTYLEESDEFFALAKYYALWKQGEVKSEGLFLQNKSPLPSRPKYKVRTLYFEDWPSLGDWI